MKFAVIFALVGLAFAIPTPHDGCIVRRHDGDGP
jgi:hypothetical protein